VVVLLACVVAATCGGCKGVAAVTCPGDRLTFPRTPLKVTPEGRFYDVNSNGKADFAILHDPSGRLDILAYDDGEDGHFDRTYRLSDYDALRVPHLIVMMDSLPHRVVAPRYAAGDWQWFYPPQKMISPFPSMSITTFNEILGGPPLGGLTEHHYDREKRQFRNRTIEQVYGYRFGWHRRTDFVVPYWTVGMMYLNPRPWYAWELARAKRAFDESHNKVSVVSVCGSSGMISRLGQQGAVEALDQIEQLCMQVLYERRGAVKITILSDHGHNFALSTNTLVGDTLRQAGYKVRTHDLRELNDVAIEADGLVTCFGVHTRRPADVAELLLEKRTEIELALYQKGEQVIIRGRAGTAAIERRGERFRVVMVDGDVLRYEPAIGDLARRGKLDADGFAADRDWLAATADHEYPDVPRRVWDTFHGLAINVPDVIFVLKDGYCAGSEFYARMATMYSTHGGLNQVNSDGIVMTMVRPLDGPLRSRDVMPAIEPRYTPNLPPRVNEQ